MIDFNVDWNVTLMMSRRASDEHTDAGERSPKIRPKQLVRAKKKKSKPQKHTMNVDNDAASANELEQFGLFFCFFLLQVWRHGCQDSAGPRQLTRSELHQPATSGLAWRRLKNSFTGVLHQYISGSRRRRMKGFGERSPTPSQKPKAFPALAGHKRVIPNRWKQSLIIRVPQNNRTEQKNVLHPVFFDLL